LTMVVWVDFGMIFAARAAHPTTGRDLPGLTVKMYALGSDFVADYPIPSGTWIGLRAFFLRKCPHCDET